MIDEGPAPAGAGPSFVPTPSIYRTVRLKPGSFTVPSGFVSAQGYTVNSREQILVSGDTSSHAEMLTTIGGSRQLG